MLHRKNKKNGFTMVELFVAIGIVTVLAVITTLVLNPSELFRQSRDARRISDLRMLDKVLAFAESNFGYDKDGPNYSNSCAGQSNQRIFISVPLESGEPNPTPPSGWSYQRANTATLQDVTGNGWLPINFVALASTIGTSPITGLPLDPVNTIASGYYYTYTCGSFEMAARLESVKYIAEIGNQDGGAEDNSFEIGSRLGETPARAAGTPTTNIPAASHSLAASYAMENSLDDSSAYLNHGTSYGGTFAAGHAGQALDLTSSAYGTIPDSLSLRMDDSMTVAAWIYYRGPSAGKGYLLTKGQNTNNNYAIFFDSGNKINFEFEDNANTQHTYTDANNVIPLNTWTHVAAVFDNSNDVVQFYVNGALVSSVSTSYAMKGSEMNDLYIGRSNMINSLNYYFNGKIDDLRIYNYALDNSEITALQ